jgi:hypothetical protein
MACLPSLIRISKVEIGLFLKKLNYKKPVLEIAPVYRLLSTWAQSRNKLTTPTARSESSLITFSRLEREGMSSPPAALIFPSASWRRGPPPIERGASR